MSFIKILRKVKLKSKAGLNVERTVFLLIDTLVITKMKHGTGYRQLGPPPPPTRPLSIGLGFTSTRYFSHFTFSFYISHTIHCINVGAIKSTSLPSHQSQVFNFGTLTRNLDLPGLMLTWGKCHKSCFQIVSVNSARVTQLQLRPQSMIISEKTAIFNKIWPVNLTAKFKMAAKSSIVQFVRNSSCCALIGQNYGPKFHRFLFLLVC